MSALPPEHVVMPVGDVRAVTAAVLDEVERAVVGKRRELELVLLGILAGGHVLLEDVPGVAKTLAVRSICQATGLGYSRIQFTPDLMPADVTGSSFYDSRRAELEFRPGPLFANLILGDEINRAPPKTQAALLEAMQEHQVTADGVTHHLPQPFAVIATQNPIEYEGTYPLPEAQLDRFLLRVAIGYPARADEEDLVRRRAERGARTPGCGRLPTPLASSPCRRQSSGWRSPRPWPPTSWPSCVPPASSPACRSAPALAPRWRCCRCRGLERPSPDATTSCPTT